MTTTPVLALLNFQRPFHVETDACADGIGAVLMQQGKPIAYLSKALGDKHRTLSIYEKEFLALIMAVEKWRPYLQRQEFMILNDHISLSYLNEQNLHSELQKKAMTRLMGLQFKIYYKQLMPLKSGPYDGTTSCFTGSTPVDSISPQLICYKCPRPEVNVLVSCIWLQLGQSPDPKRYNYLDWQQFSFAN